MAFFDGIRSSLKLDEVAGGVASKLQGAKEFLAEKQQSVSESGPMKLVKQKVSDLGSTQVGTYLNSWSKYLPAGAGKRQSPIDLITSEALFDETLGDGQFKFHYVSTDCVQLENTGVSIQITCRPSAESTVSATHLGTDAYRLQQLHLHWGTEPMNGSEHLVGGVGYAGELHIVHYNAGCANIDEAMKRPDGIAVIAVFLNESHDDNPNLAPIIDRLAQLTYKGDQVALDGSAMVHIERLLPDKTEFWTYEGSLTTPPFSECVIWTVFRASIPISSNQLDKLRQLYAVGVEDAERNAQFLVNVRPTQPTNGRPIRASFRSGGVVPPANNC